MEIKKKLFSADIIKGEGDKQGLFLFVISDGLMDRHAESVNPDGWDFKDFNNNPVCLIGHDYGTLPVGKWLPPFVENGQVKAYLQLADTERGKEARYLIENDFLKTVSVGFRVNKWGNNGDSHTIMQQTLYEVSLVSIPANTRAQRVKDAQALEAFENIEREMQKKTVTIPVEELFEMISAEFGKAWDRAIIKEMMEEVIGEKKIVEEKVVEKIKVVQGVVLSDSAMTLLMEIQKQAEKSAKKSDRTSDLITSLLNIKHSTEGGEK